MKIDGRQLDRKAQEAIRLMAVERVREGESPSDVIASYGMNRTTIHKWLDRAKGKGAGLRKLKASKGTGRPRKLDAKQEWIRLWIVDAQYRLHVDRREVRHQVEPGIGRRVAGPVELDSAEAS